MRTWTLAMEGGALGALRPKDAGGDAALASWSCDGPVACSGAKPGRRMDTRAGDTNGRSGSVGGMPPRDGGGLPVLGWRDARAICKRGKTREREAGGRWLW